MNAGSEGSRECRKTNKSKTKTGKEKKRKKKIKKNGSASKSMQRNTPRRANGISVYNKPNVKRTSIKKWLKMKTGKNY